jgi:hypothetical protein
LAVNANPITSILPKRNMDKPTLLDGRPTRPLALHAGICIDNVDAGRDKQRGATSRGQHRSAVDSERV